LSSCQKGVLPEHRTLSFKLRVVAYAVEKGNRAAGKQFSIDESCVHRWRLQREKLLKTP